jgi:hypothetical protein
MGTFEGTMALTDTEIKKAKPREKAYRMSDSGGMYLWVTPSGGNAPTDQTDQKQAQ